MLTRITTIEVERHPIELSNENKIIRFIYLDHFLVLSPHGCGLLLLNYR
jgi:hypothetical protein